VDGGEQLGHARERFGVAGFAHDRTPHRRGALLVTGSQGDPAEAELRTRIGRILTFALRSRAFQPPRCCLVHVVCPRA